MSVTFYLLEVEIDVEIDPKGNPVSNDNNNLDSLRKHHQLILEHIHYQLGVGDVPCYAIENSWTMKVEDTISALQRLREDGNGNNWKTVVEKGKEKERIEESLLVCDYLMHSSTEKERRLLDEGRANWITRRMKMITKETKARFQGIKGVEYRVDKQTVDKKPATTSPEEIDWQLVWEQGMMELLLLYEVNEWEQLFLNKMKALLNQIGNDRVEVKERLTREWRGDCWRRLNPQMRAAQKRLADCNEDMSLLDSVSGLWASSISRFFEGVENQSSISLKEEIESQIDLQEQYYPLYEVRAGIEKEMEDIDFRLKRGSELGRFDQHWDDDTLFDFRYSRSKWLLFNLDQSNLNAPLEIYSHALKGNKNIIHITFDRNFDVTQFSIRDLPWVTSICRDSPFGLPAIHDGPLFIRSTHYDLITFANEIRPKLDPSSSYIFTDATTWSDTTYSGELRNYARVLISFFAPTSGQSLTLRLKHSGKEDAPLEVTLESTIIQQEF